MTFSVSPVVDVREIDTTLVPAAVSTTIGGMAGAFSWGPSSERTLVTSENDLVEKFWKPNDDVFADWMSASSFLAYANNLLLVRKVGILARNSSVTAGGIAVSSAPTVENETDFDGFTFTDETFVGKYPGVLGNSLKIHIADSVIFPNWRYRAEFDGAPGTSSYVSNRGGSLDEVHVIVIDEDGQWTGTAGTILEKFSFISKASDAKKLDGSTNYLVNVLKNESKYAWVGAVGTIGTTPFAGGASTVSFGATALAGDGDRLAGVTITTPGTLYAVDDTFTWSDGTPTTQGTGTITAVGGGGEITAVRLDTIGAGYATAPVTAVITTTSGTGGAVTGVLEDLGQGGSLVGGVDDNSSTGVTDSIRQNGWSLFANAEEVDVTLLFAGAGNPTVGKWIVDNIADVRKDLVVCVSPAQASVVNNSGSEQTATLSDGTTLGASSYAFMDSAYKYMLDRYNDITRWVPLNGDMAGLMARTDKTNDAWFSPAGFNRGNIKNAIKLSWSQSKADRDELYKASINPIVNFKGQGILLFGDKTMLLKPSAFDRINVRRLFIVLEKSIATSAKFQLFELNNEFTRRQFKNLVEPFLRNVQGRQGITDFKVIADTTNNPGFVVDANQFIGDIFIKPARSINFIQLNFIATATDVSFDEIGS